MMVEAFQPPDLAQWLSLQGTGSGSQRGSGPRIGTWRSNYGTNFQLGLMKGNDATPEFYKNAKAEPPPTQ